MRVCPRGLQSAPQHVLRMHAAALASTPPAAETINGRLAMLGVLTGLLGEVYTGKGLLEQTADHPITVFLSFVIISIATYVPIVKVRMQQSAAGCAFARAFADCACRGARA